MKKEQYEEIKSAYNDILSMCEKYKGIEEKYGNDFCDIGHTRESAKNHLMLIDWAETYGIEIGHRHKPYSANYINLGGYCSINYFKDALEEKRMGYGKYISLSDDGRQPNYEWLYEIGFPTGPYIFGSNYDEMKPYFQEFIQELKTYSPDFLDTVNDCFYWKLENAKAIHEDLYDILKKYGAKIKAESKKRNLERLKEELKKAEEEINIPTGK